MAMSSLTFIISLVIIVFFKIQSGLLISQHPKLLIISYDAFRYDYFDRNVTPYMKKLKHANTYADYMMNIFVTKTMPNHHTMATGLYAETHGVIDNLFYDPISGNVAKYSYELYHYNNDILPIWTVNEKAGNGRHSGCMMWPGSVYEYQGISPTFMQNYNESISFQDRIDTLLSWFVHPTTPINLGILYFEDPDYHGHMLGINSPAFNEVLNKLDNLTEYLHKKLDELNLNDVNVVHLSDHGMTSVTLDRIVNLTNYINETDYTFVGSSPGLHIYPKLGKEEIIYSNLKKAAEETKKFKVYKREEIPKKYHYGNNIRVGPIFVIAESGYAFQNIWTNINYYEKYFNITVNNKSEFGLHGYDNELNEMHPMFFAKGPAFSPECKLNPFNNTDLFPLFCELLDLKCPFVNGTLAHVNKCLTQESPNSGGVQILLVAGILVSIGVIIIVIALIMKRRTKMRTLVHRNVYDIVE